MNNEMVTRQFTAQCLGWRLLRAFLGALMAITALGHFPGYDNNAGAFVPVGEALFEWVGVLGVFVSGLLTGGVKPSGVK